MVSASGTKVLLLILCLALFAFSAPLLAQDEGEGPSAIPEGMQDWQEGQYTVTQTSSSQGTMKMTTTIRTEIAGRTQDAITMKTTTTVNTKIDISGREVLNKSVTTVDTVMDFAAQSMTTSTTTSSDGMQSGPFNATIPLDMSKVPQAQASNVKAPEFKVESITTPAGTFECKVYTFGEGDFATKTYMSDQVPLGGVVKTKGPGVDITLIEYNK